MTGCLAEPNPPASNRGVHPVTLCFDWYGATIPAAPGPVIGTLRDVLGADVAVVTPNRRYDKAFSLSVSGRVLCRVSSGRAYEGCFVESTGDSAPVVVPIIRRHWPEHRVARVDVAVDFVDVDFYDFDRIAKTAFLIADKHGLVTDCSGDWLEAVRGRTLYLGSRTSRARMCIYEKGKEQSVDHDWTRLELRIRPHSRNKGDFAQASPAQCWNGYNPAVEIMEALGMPLPAEEGIRDPRAKIRDDIERARNAVAAQYAKTINAWVRDAGGAEEFLAELNARAAELSAEKKAVRDRQPGSREILEKWFQDDPDVLKSLLS